MPTLTFKEPQKAWASVGVLKNDDGNEFLIYVSAYYKEDIDRFIRYQEQKVEKGEIGISVQVTQLIEPPDLPDLNSSAISSGEEEATDISIKANGVRIGISRRKIVTDPPYKVSYLVDPPISQNGVQTFSFDNQTVADLKCTVTDGSVRVELSEVTDSERKLLRRAFIVGANQSKTMREIKNHTGSWFVSVIGEGANNYFTLGYDKVVT